LLIGGRYELVGLFIPVAAAQCPFSVSTFRLG